MGNVASNKEGGGGFVIQKLGLSALAIAMLAGCAEPNSAELADVFGDHMVIQRDQPVRVFGTGEPGT
ncbi:MAG TPA: hypothetical protein DDY28_11435, partial [Hyphomonas atlantica]|nr:hypothetical protein [Hyphomonas atlantica]